MIPALLFAFASGAAEPNELGRILILEYHQIGEPEARWTRTPAGLRQDLQRLWDLGYRLVALGDLLDGNLNLPAGTSPVVLTFDDSSPGQLRYLETPEGFVRDPDCAVAILEAFEREHPGFGHAATFFVLPGASAPNRLFNQPEWAATKLQYLASNGYEIGNHTLWHANLSRYPEAVVRQQVADAQTWIQRDVPGYLPRTISLPMGAYPATLAWVVDGEVGGVRYRHDAVLMVAGGAARSPYDRAFDPLHLPRIQAMESEISSWLLRFEQHPEERYVSDGDPATITVRRGTAADLRPGLSPVVVEQP